MTSDARAATPEFLLPGEADPAIEARATGAVRRHFWRVLRRAATLVPFAEDLVAAYLCAFDPATPRRVRLTLLGALAYFVTPLDAVPDLLAVIGFTDDVAVLTAAIGLVAANILPRHRDAAKGLLAQG